MEWFFGVLATVLSSVTVLAIGALGKMLTSFVREQRAVNESNTMFQRSMQRAEIMRYFRIVVEQGNPISPEELTHVESCYKAYHDNGGNGVGTLMYERICEHARLVTQVQADNKPQEGE